MTKSKEVKVTICPPAPQEVFFQETQFDDTLGSGTDPNAYVRGQLPSHRGKLKSNGGAGVFVRKKRLKQAKDALEGHENREEILKILQKGE